MVVFPAPEGAEKMMASPSPWGLVPAGMGDSEHVEHLLFDFLEFVLHLHHHLLQIGIVGFAAQRVDFTPHFLGHEAKFFALSMANLELLTSPSFTLRYSIKESTLLEKLGILLGASGNFALNRSIAF